MSIPASLEDRINDPITLEPFKEVQLTNCKHRFSLSSARAVFGEMKEGSCTLPSPCPSCKQRVTKYESDPIFQDIIDQIILSSKPEPKAPVVQQVPLIPTTSNLPKDIIKEIEKGRDTRSASSQDVPVKFPIFDQFKEREKSSTDSILSDEEIARALQEEFNREIQNPKSSQPQLPLGQYPGKAANVAPEKSLWDTASGLIEIAKQAAQANSSGISQYVQNNGLGASNAYPQPPLTATSSQSIKPRVPQEKMVYNLNGNQNYLLPEKSENCEINAGVNSKITIGDNGFAIKVNGSTNTEVQVGNKCSNLSIIGQVGGKIILGNSCSDCTLSLGGINGKATLGDNCSNIQIYLGLGASYKLGKNCKNITVNGGRVV
jgi:hypothetical protein